MMEDNEEGLDSSEEEEEAEESVIIPMQLASFSVPIQAVHELEALLKPEYKCLIHHLCWKSLTRLRHSKVRKWVRQRDALFRQFQVYPSWVGVNCNTGRVKHYVCVCNPFIGSYFIKWLRKKMEASQDPHYFVQDSQPVALVHIWTHGKDHVLYRLPLELIRMIAEFIC